ncbi:DHA1 family purine base/nucleoside efflux pump-like MFS transporter [Aminobacter aminovorans]|uniref:Purine efflux pump PbuE n=1 Tax=Aminobacter aminovorans TaxID=83263 RepID=A0A380WJC1_AMIAI|nr:MFS transporter [Aminobacter aminovorans]TCS29220.1 DHA1 family purine base/nucleoside efflux pump-like MFS transporter [Aminobacter aminovorans]SUU89073.1 Purine efflux pump PbuE [Aminobacter aminovorans]
MDPRIFLFALATFATGTAENIVIGILPDVAASLGVSLGLAGQLTTAFSLAFALAAPAALVLTGRMERKSILALALALFILSNLVAALSPGIAVLFAARIAMAAASAAVCLVATMLATELAGPERRGRAIGLIFVGISGSMVLGVPAGMLVNNLLGWRSVFVALALLAFLVLAVCQLLLPISASRPLGVAGYRRHVGSLRLVSGQLASIMMIGGHFVLFAYLAPYVVDVVGFDDEKLAPIFMAFGIAGVSGGYLGGWLTDVLAPRTTIVVVPLAYLVVLLAIPAASSMPLVFLGLMMVWACISWMISPVVQSFLISAGPDTAEAGVSLNLSAMHVGVALGTAIGGLVLEHGSTAVLPWTGTILTTLAVAASLIAAWRVADKPRRPAIEV